MPQHRRGSYDLATGFRPRGSVVKHIESVRKEVTAGTIGTCLCSYVVHLKSLRMLETWTWAMGFRIGRCNGIHAKINLISTLFGPN